MKTLIISTLAILSANAVFAAPSISPLQGSTEIPQWQYKGLDPKNPEWFSRYSSQLDTPTLQNFKNAPGNANGLNLFASGDTVKVTYLGTGATRDSLLFLASATNGPFNTSSFWNPIYASGGTNNTNTYNPVNAGNTLFQTRAGCSFAQAKAGNTCIVTQIGETREITGLTKGENLVFGLQTLPLVYNGGGSTINLPNTHYFFTGDAANNSDAKGWNDSTLHAKVLKIDSDKYLVGFEDTWLGKGSTSDRDYNDMVFLFQGVTPAVPEPSTVAMMLAGLGMVGAMAARRRNK